MLSPPRFHADPRPATSSCLLPIAAIFSAAALLLPGCGEDTPGPAVPAPAPAPAPTPPPPPPEPSEPETAQYTFAMPEVRISPRVPGTLPEGVKFSDPLVFVAHARDAAPFDVDDTASDGLRLLAETGAPDALLGEAQAASMDIVAAHFGQLLQVFLSPDPSIELSLERPCLSYAQRIDPSSDWFIGFSNVCATDDEGRWMDAVSAELLAYDAGTATGEAFQEKSGDTDPREPIALLDAEPYFVAPAVVQVLSATRKEE